jgi:hypothetical protein
VTTLGREAIGRSCPGAVRLRRLAALALAGGTQALDRGRLLIIILPLTFDRSLEYSFERGQGATATAAQAGVAVAAVFFAWGWAVGRSFHWSLSEFPTTTDAFLRNHPAAVGVVSTAINGFPRTRSEYEELSLRTGTDRYRHFEFGPYATSSSRTSKVLLALSRGVKTAFIFGTTAHVGVAKVSRFSDSAVKRRTWVVALEAAAVLGTLAVLVSTLVSYDFLGVAQRIRDVVTDRRILISTSVIVIIASAIDNYFRRRSLSTESV